jgi:hypothetical protein
MGIIFGPCSERKSAFSELEQIQNDPNLRGRR